MVYYLCIDISYPYADVVIKIILKVRIPQSKTSFLRLTPQDPPAHTEQLKVIYCWNYYIFLILYFGGITPTFNVYMHFCKHRLWWVKTFNGYCLLYVEEWAKSFNDRIRKKPCGRV